MGSSPSLSLLLDTDVLIAFLALLHRRFIKEKPVTVVRVYNSLNEQVHTRSPYNVQESP